MAYAGGGRAAERCSPGTEAAAAAAAAAAAMHSDGKNTGCEVHTAPVHWRCGLAVMERYRRAGTVFGLDSSPVDVILVIEGRRWMTSGWNVGFRSANCPPCPQSCHGDPHRCRRSRRDWASEAGTATTYRYWPLHCSFSLAEEGRVPTLMCRCSNRQPPVGWHWHLSLAGEGLNDLRHRCSRH